MIGLMSSFLVLNLCLVVKMLTLVFSNLSFLVLLVLFMTISKVKSNFTQYKYLFFELILLVMRKIRKTRKWPDMIPYRKRYPKISVSSDPINVCDFCVSSEICLNNGKIS